MRHLSSCVGRLAGVWHLMAHIANVSLLYEVQYLTTGEESSWKTEDVVYEWLSDSYRSANMDLANGLSFQTPRVYD